MRRNILFAVFASALLCLSQIISAVPAKPGKQTRVQPDGSRIIITVHGDEWFHYVTDSDGNILEENGSGFLVKSTETLQAVRQKMAAARAEKRLALQKAQQAVLQAARAQGTQKIPVVLVQFSDKSFSISNPKTAFTNLLTQAGYSANGGTGSVRDYYLDQSRGLYNPEFVVMDVVTLSGRMSAYGAEDTNAATALYEACQQLDATVDFSQFDNDGDGYIDMALMYFAGYNEAEGASSATIWPHQYYVPYVVRNAQSFDGVKLNRYFCTSELQGSYGTKMCGIGTTCHEFAHSLGLPDFYDTDYEDNGECGATYAYDVMCSGSYNNSGCTPPWMNAEELVMLGWMGPITEMPSGGQVTIPSIGADATVAYKTSTAVDGEYFLYECRPGTGWDAPLSAGLLVYHVDKSSAHTITWTDDYGSNSQTASRLWSNWESTNAINVKGSHPCFYIVPSGALTSLNYSGRNFTFPGGGNVTAYTPVDWTGSDTGISLSGISFNSAAASSTFTIVNSNIPSLEGVVTDSGGEAIPGATVAIRATSAMMSAPSRSDAARRMSVMRASGAVLYTATTDASGMYCITLDNAGSFTVEASKDGYVSKSVTLDINRPVTQNFSLLREGEELPSQLYLFPTDGDIYGVGDGSTTSWSYMAANCYTSSFLSSYAGKQIKTLSFMIAGEADDAGNTTTTGDVYAIIDYGSQRKMNLKVENPAVNNWTVVDVTAEELIIPSGTDIYAGYALRNWKYTYPFIATDPADDGGYLAPFSLESSAWDEYDDFIFIIMMTVGDYTAPETGYNFIEDSGVHHVGEEIVLNLLETSSGRRPSSAGISWFYDDEPVSGSVRLSSAGTHTITAKFTTESGDWKVIELEIEVQ